MHDSGGDDAMEDGSGCCPRTTFTNASHVVVSGSVAVTMSQLGHSVSPLVVVMQRCQQRRPLGVTDILNH